MEGWHHYDYEKEDLSEFAFEFRPHADLEIYLDLVLYGKDESSPLIMSTYSTAHT